ncbi:MAG TPA: ATP-binding protein [Gaiellaceae bacterium]|nr:ATP-binding protein [Gaiellaceae bacterium]
MSRAEDEEQDEVARARAFARDLRQQPSLAPVCDLLESLASSLEAARRRGLRMGYDLHDGALQEVAALGHDIHLFREQLGSEGAFEHRRILVGRVDDLLARLLAIDLNLREVATQSTPPLLAGVTLRVALAHTAELAAGDVAVTLDVDATLDESGITDSQRIVMIRVVQGALTNTARHSGASRASVTVRQAGEEILLEVRDDGQGFDLEEALRRGPETGRIGLPAMRERARLLGGELTIDSSPTRSTAVLLRLPRWRPQ